MDELLFSYAEPSDPPLKRSLIRLIERATGQPHLKRLYMDFRNGADAPESFFAQAIRRLDLTVDFDSGKLAAIPRAGPLVVVANHPYGVLDGIVVSWLVQQVRSDFLVLTNAVLLRAPEVRRYLLPIDFSPSEAAMRTNIESRAAARRHLEQGGCVVVFPAGGVSTAPDRLGRRRAVDADWQPFTGQLVQRGRATVLPIFFAGQNSRLFQIASHIHATLRLSLIFKEVRDRIGTRLPVAIGDPIPFAHIAGFADRKALADELRRRTHALAGEMPVGEGRAPGRPALPSLARLIASNGRGGRRITGRNALRPEH